MPISLVLDIIIAMLLVLTIAYAVRLNQRLSQLRSDKNELQKLAKTFAEATVRAEAGIQNLKISSEALQEQVKRAEVVKDDLAYLLERGTRTADEMVETVRKPGAPTAPVEPLRRPGPAMARGMKPERTHGVEDPEARLIEDAIRAATPGQVDERDMLVDENDLVTRRISGQGRPAKPARPVNAQAADRPSLAAKASSRPGTLASRGLHMADDDEAIGDTEAARELLKALSSVK